MSTHQSGSKSNLESEGLAQDSSDQIQDQEASAQAEAEARPSATGSGTIKVTG